MLLLLFLDPARRQCGHALLARPGSTHALMQHGDDALVILLAYPKATN